MSEETTPQVIVVSEPEVIPASQFVVNGTLSDCCSKPENLGEEQRLRTPQTNLPFDVRYRVCRNCGRRHMRMKAEGDGKPKIPKIVRCGGCQNLVFMTEVGCPVCYNRRMIELVNSIQKKN
jgi:hypothetical protein